jgi:hypothetical protein
MKTSVRYLPLIPLIIVASVLSGCATDVVMMNPRTGETAVCGASLRGLNPWSQQQACIGEHIAGGWTKLE